MMRLSGLVRSLKYNHRGFSGGPVVKNLPCNVRDTGSNPDWELRTHMTHDTTRESLHCNGRS